MNSSWFLQLDEKVVGPISITELCQLARDGGIRPDASISSDQMRWHRATDIQELKSAFSQPVNPEKVSLNDGRIAFWIVGAGLVLGVILLVTFCGLAVIISPGDTNSTPVIEDPAPAIGRVSYQYWQTIGAIPNSIQFSGNSKQKADSLTRAAVEIEKVPVVNVDPDAVQCALNLSATLRLCAEVGERNNDPSIFVEVIARGLSGDPFGKGLEMMQESRQLQQTLTNLQSEIAKTRAVLSQRYGTEFPTW